MIRVLLLAGLLGLLLPDIAAADRKQRAAECERLRVQIRNVESRMRAGYTRAQGERYAEKLRELKAKRYKLCR